MSMKFRRLATRGFLVLLTLSLVALPGQQAQARHWMLADQRIWTVLRACTDGVVALAVHQASTDPNYIPGPTDPPAWVQLGVRKIANPAAPLPDIDGKLTVTPASYNPSELVPFATRNMDQHDKNSGLVIDPGDNPPRYYIYAFIELTWSTALVPGTDRVIVIGGELDQPTQFKGIVASVENCHVSQYRFPRKPTATISGAHFPALSPHLSASLPLYHGSQPGLGAVRLNNAPLLNPFTLRQNDIDSGKVTYASNATSLQNDLLALRPTSIVLESADPDGASAYGVSFSPELSRDGRFMSFGSTASSLPGGNGVNEQVYLRDRDADGNGIFDDPGGVSTSLVSSRPDGSPSSGSAYPRLSGDGRWVAFSSMDTNLVPNDTNSTADIFVRGSGGLRRVSVATDGTQANFYSSTPALSETGRFVTFASYATNLAPGVSTSLKRIYLHDRDTDDNGVFDEPGPGKTSTILVSKDDQGHPATDISDMPSLSADGRYVVYESDASNLVAGDTNGVRDVFLFDRLTRHTERISVTWDGQEADAQSNLRDAHVISDDGRFVAFQSDASNLLSNNFDNNGLTDVYVRDRVAGQTRLISYNDSRSGPASGSGGSGYPSISANGRWIVFESSSSDLIAENPPSCAVNGSCRQIYIFDQETHDTVLASTSASLTPGDSHSWEAAISGDGSFITFTSLASNLVAGDNNKASDVFVAASSFPFYFPILTNRTVFLPFQRR